MALILASEASAKGCRDVELEEACKAALISADELMLQKDAKAIYLESQLKIQMSQNEMAQKLIIDLANPSWYAKPEYTFLLGIVAGAIIITGVSK